MAEEIANNNMTTEAQSLSTVEKIAAMQTSANPQTSIESDAADKAEIASLQSIFKPRVTTAQPQEETAETKSMIKCWADALTRLTDFNGRMTRYEFWAFQSVSLVIFLLLAFVGYFLSEPKMVIDIFAVYFLLPAISSGTRRLHDIDLSGWWTAPAVILALTTLICWNLNVRNMILLLFATLVYGTYLLYLLRQKNNGADNKYGPSIRENEKYHFESRVYINFIFTFMLGLWLIFTAYLFKF